MGWVDVLSLIALASGVCLRVVRAWAGRISTDPDPAVVGLMARHMAEGTDFPLFFYGQSYMGSLEPAASGVLFWLFGPSGFALGLGPVLFGCIALWALGAWGKAAAGSKGRLWALLGGCFGPVMYFQFQATPRGGYMVSLAIETIALLWAARMGAALWRGEKPSLFRWLALGLLAGVGLWSNLIVVPALVVAAGLLAVGMRGRIWRYVREGAVALLGTGVGMGPWVWDIFRRGGMDSLVQADGGMVFREQLARAWMNYRTFMDGGGVSPEVSVTLTLAVTTLALLGAIMTWIFRKRATPLENMARAAACGLAIVFGVTYLCSGFAAVRTGRYWIPLAPALTILAATACTAPTARHVNGARRGRQWHGVWRTILPAIFLLVVMTEGILCVNGMRGAAARSKRTEAGICNAVTELKKHGVQELLAPLSMYYLNFYSDETVAVSDGLKGFYRPILQKLECAENPAVEMSYPGVRTWLEVTGTAFRNFQAGGIEVAYDLKSFLPEDREISIPPHRVTLMENGTEISDTTTSSFAEASVLTDRHLDTYLEGRAEQVALEWQFEEPKNVSVLRLQFTHRMASFRHVAPRRVRIEIRRDGQWQEVREERLSTLEESLGRPYPSLAPAAMEIRLRAADAEGLRVTLFDADTTPGKEPWRLAETFLFEIIPDGGNRLDSCFSESALLDLAQRVVQASEDTWLYAPRRLSGQLAARALVDSARLGGLPAHVFIDSPAARLRGDMPSDRPLLFCVEPRMAASTEHALHAALRAWQKEERPEGWILYSISPADWREDVSVPLLQWTGDLPLTANSFLAANELCDKIEHALSQGECPAEDIRQLAGIRPESLIAIPEEAVRAASVTNGLDLLAVRRDHACLPAIPCETTFTDGLQLAGIDVAPAVAKPGDRITVTLYWRSNGQSRTRPESTFLHLCNADGAIVAQADWAGVANAMGLPSFGLPLRECYPETREIVLPSNLPPGPLQIRAGRHRPGWRWRVPITRSQGCVKERAVRQDGLLEIRP